jgi:hypothetical protein
VVKLSADNRNTVMTTDPAMTIGGLNLQKRQYKQATGALLLGLAISFAGYLLGHWVQGLYAPSTVGIGNASPVRRAFELLGSPVFLSATLLIAAAKESLAYIPAIRKILRGEQWIELWMPSIAVFCSLFAIGFALPNKFPNVPPGAQSQIVPQGQSVPTVVLEVGDLGIVRFSDPSKGLLTIAVPFSKDNPGHAFEQGVSVEEPSKELLKRLGEALAKCEGDNGLRARVEVVGFASSLGPKSDPAAFQRIELTAAQDRADHVKALLEEGARLVKPQGPLPIEVDAPKWSTYQRMESEIRFNDLIGSQYDGILGNFTRRAEIRVRTAGKCEIVAPEQEKVTIAKK